MLYLFFGEPEEKKNAREKVFAQGQFSGVFAFSQEDLALEKLDELAASKALFAGDFFVTIENVFANKELKTSVLKKLEDFAASPNTFVFLETKALKEILDAFKKVGATVKEFKGVPAAEKEFFNSFALTDAVAKRDKKESWVLLARAFMVGKSPEELSGLLFWQLKNLLLVKGDGTALSLEMKPFVFSKTQASAEKWTMEELSALTSELVSGTHESRRGEVDPQAVLEKLILEKV